MYSMTVITLTQMPGNEKNVKELYDEFKKYIPDELKNKEKYQYKEDQFYIHIPIPIDLEAFDQLKKIAKENHITTGTYEFSEYTKKEIKNAEYFQMYVSDRLQAEGTFASDYGTKYDYSCEKCQIGGVPIGDVLVDRKFVKKCDIGNLRPDIFVSKQVKWLIETSGLTGVSFEHRVLDYKGREIPEYYVMTFGSILPPMDKKTLFTYDPPANFCPECGRIVPYLMSHCYYKRADFANAKDFNLAYEPCNNWSQQPIIVSRKVKEVFDSAKVRVGYDMLNVIE